ncbi:hypothetical protein [Natronorubrum tibetense]|uniref:Uncharacterized protein n=1 Tax=Natronorubrum tibetense GA33 TaxID=1114856 RepID=L9VKB6_9EURY|nr:hypothetical protein [Natronorubrum tibetense]ELY37650.1 hypothetical protein C496_19110 [Natronorubrum tibetense GA33]
MGLIDDLRKMKRTVDRTVEAVEDPDAELFQQWLARLIGEYVRGEISATEFEQELAKHIDDPNAGIEIIVEAFTDVDAATATAVATEYQSLSDLEDTDQARLESVAGIDPVTADLLLERLHQ